jgi:formylglycine-generating enzyme required for sulfatase activity
MGSPTTELERVNDELQHRVTVSDFYLAKSEVTQREYRALMGNTPSNSQGDNVT